MTNNPTFTLDDTVALFCLPLGANMECWRAGTSNTDISKSTFVLTLGNAAKVSWDWSVCCHVTER